MSDYICGIYKIKHKPSGRYYVGSSKNIPIRIKTHFRELKRNGHHSKKFQNVWNKYGSDSFETTVVLYCSEDNLYYYEQLVLDLAIRSKRSLNGSKIVTPGSWKPLSQEHRANISKALSGKAKTKEHNEAVSKALTGYKRPYKPLTSKHKVATKKGITNYWKNMGEEERAYRLQVLREAGQKGRDSKQRAVELTARLERQAIDPKHRVV